MVSAGFQLEYAERCFRRLMLRAALVQTHGNQSRAARLLGVHRNLVVRELHEEK
jgi:DNA-binding protein Fis